MNNIRPPLRGILPVSRLIPYFDHRLGCYV
jgi:hypothetical protein